MSAKVSSLHGVNITRVRTSMHVHMSADRMILWYCDICLDSSQALKTGGLQHTTNNMIATRMKPHQHLVDLKLHRQRTESKTLRAT